jgi:hypothetical protein
MKTKFGLFASGVGIVSVAFAVIAKRAFMFSATSQGTVLTWLSELGVVKKPELGGITEIGAPRLLLWTDESVRNWTFTYSIWFALCAMGCAIWATRKREPTLYLGLGFICGASAITYSEFYWGLVASTFGAIALFSVRKGQRYDSTDSLG